MKNSKMLFVLFVFLAGVFSCKKAYYSERIESILGLHCKEKPLLSYQYEEFGGFGEGFAIEVYKIGDKDLEAFIRKSKKEIPNRENNQEGWRKKNWQMNEQSKSDSIIFESSLNVYAENQELEIHLHHVKDAILRKQFCYAFYACCEIEYSNRSVLFFIDLYRKELYIISSSF